jgi:hypothetical protein
MKVTEDPQTTAFYDALKAAEQGPTIPSDAPHPAPWTMPPEDWRNRAEMKFTAFVFHKHEDNCINCGAVHHWGDVYRAFTHKSNLSTRQLVPFASPLPSSAELVIFSLPARKVPICTHCITARSASGDSTVYLVSSEAAWNEAIKREQEAIANQRRQATAKRNAGNPAMDMNSVPTDL